LNVTLTDEGCPAIQARVAAGSTFRVKFTNQGQESQQVRLMVYPQSAGIDLQDEKNIYWQVRVQPGFSLIEDVTAPQMPGEYEIVCGPGTKADLPVTGMLTVIQSQN
jgi:hypothetical protein